MSQQNRSAIIVAMAQVGPTVTGRERILESDQIFLFSHGQDLERTSLRPDIHKCLWLTMRVFLVGFEI